MDYSGRQDFTPNVECEHGYALLNVVLNSDAIGIAGQSNLAPFLREGALVALQPVDLPADLEECYTRYGVVSRVGYSLAPGPGHGPPHHRGGRGHPSRARGPGGRPIRGLTATGHGASVMGLFVGADSSAK